MPISPTTTPPASLNSGTGVNLPAAHQAEKDLRELISLAAAGLVPMFDVRQQMFCTKFIRAESGMVQEGISPRYTLITLMGLRRLEQGGVTSPIPVLPSFDALMRGSVSAGSAAPSSADSPGAAHPTNSTWVTNAGDLGLLLWLCALVAPQRIEEFLAQHDLQAALARFADGRQRRTMELSWVLSGLAHAAFARPELRERLTPLAAEISANLLENRGSHGAFGHQSPSGTAASGAGLAGSLGATLTGPLRGRLGSFADQVYPIYAFAWAHRAFQFPGALEIANACAENICREQGELGQWWWHYDAKSGQAVGKYPVYAVHQHAMAPLALFALMDAGGRDSTRELYLGLGWIYGANELNVDMRDVGEKVVWRCIRPGKARRYVDEARAMLKIAGKPRKPQELHVLQECWPYELGWLLYAFAGRAIR